MDLLGQAAGPLHVVAAVRRIHGLEPLGAYQREMVTVVRRLLDDGVEVHEVTQAVARVNDILTARLLHLAEAELGPPPRAYAWLALGSHGRGEQVLSSDQDSALAYDDHGPAPEWGPAPESGRPTGGPVAEYFHRLAALVVTALARAGLPLCDGGYMATTWCRPIGEFSGLFRSWVEQPEPEALLRAEVFLDVRPVYGELSVGVLDQILVSGGSQGRFLVQMARAGVTFPPALGPFGRFRTRDGTIDVKRAGIAAIVLLARLYGLAAESSARTTLARLDAAAAAGTLSRVGAADLAEAYRHLTALRLRHQLEQVDAGLPPDNQLRLGTLTGKDRSRLRESMRVVRDVQNVTAMRFSTSTVM